MELARELFVHGSIVTSEAKAKRLRPLAERLIKLAKRGDIHSRRTVLVTIHDKQVVDILFSEIAPSLEDRDTGYTRIVKLGRRKPDDVPVAQIILDTGDLGRRRNDGLPRPADALGRLGDRVESRILATFEAESRDHLVAIAERLDLRVRGYGRDSRTVLAIRSLHPSPQPPALLQLMRATGDEPDQTFIIRVSWVGEEPASVRELAGEVWDAVAAESEFPR